MQFFHKIKSKLPISPEVHTPPLALLTQVTALAILSSTRLKQYKKLLIYKWNKYSSELTLFPYRRNFYSAAIFFLQTFQLHLKWPQCVQCAFQTRRNVNHHKNRSQQQLREELPLLPTAATAQQHIPGCKGWRTRNSHPSPSNDVGTAFLPPKQRYFFQLGGLSAEKRENALVVEAVSWNSSSGVNL